MIIAADNHTFWRHFNWTENNLLLTYLPLDTTVLSEPRISCIHFFIIFVLMLLFSFINYPPIISSMTDLSISYHLHCFLTAFWYCNLIHSLHVSCHLNLFQQTIPQLFYQTPNIVIISYNLDLSISLWTKCFS